MAPDDFHYLARLLRRRCGLSLSVDKMALVERRLLPVMRRFHFKDMGSMIGDLRLGGEALAEAVAEAMTINESSFFRDQELFTALRDSVLPSLIAARNAQRRLRIWSAACAAGQEAYSIAITLSEMGLARAGWQLEILATDLSAVMIGRAESGRYRPHETQRGLNEEMQSRYFRRQATNWVVSESLRRMVRFRRFNLLDSFGWLDDVDVVFCRNVLMYFEAATRADVLMRLADTLAPDGLLVLGENETAGHTSFQPSTHGPEFYVKSRLLLSQAG
jgi:chemotaxis protein methyltransferase CheR